MWWCIPIYILFLVLLWRMWVYFYVFLWCMWWIVVIYWNNGIVRYAKMAIYLYTNICSIIFCSNSPDPKQNICSTLGKMGKNRLFQGGATKNQNKCSVFPAAYKLVHLHTNFILKHLNKNPTKPSKIKHFINLSYQIPISHPISSNPTKINTFAHFTTQF